MLKILKKIWGILPLREKWIFIFLTFLMIVGAWLELLGLGMVLPLVAVLTDPEILEKNRILAELYKFLSPGGAKEFLLYLCTLTILLFLLKNLYLLFLTHLQIRFICRLGLFFGEKLFSNYIFAPVSYHTARGSSPLLGNFGLLQQLTSQTILSFMILLTELVNVFFILLLLTLVTPGTALGLLALFIPFGGLLVWAVRWKIASLGREIYQYSLAATKIVLESFHGIKLVKLLGCEKFLLNSFVKSKTVENELSAKACLYGQAPRFLIEIILISGAVGILIAFLFSGMKTEAIVLNFSLIGAAIVRLMPSFTRIQYNYTNFRVMSDGFKPILLDITDIKREELGQDAASLTLDKGISLRNVDFSYVDEKGNEKKVLDGFSLEIPAKSSLAFIGTTGCGKTTTVDLIAGLFRPQKGEILCDGKNIFSSLRSWREKIGYVPQEILLTDDTLAGNIAFGIPEKEWKKERFEEVIKMAQLEDVVANLPHGLQTPIGENGVRLSGGQRQRIGIARALYRKPELLILDEATSALDNETEKAFMDALQTLQGKLTLILIAHRLTTTQYCDKVVDMSSKK